jgi:hypothetical protein
VKKRIIYAGKKLVTYLKIRYNDTKRNYIRIRSDVKCTGIFDAVDGRLRISIHDFVTSVISIAKLWDFV